MSAQPNWGLLGAASQLGVLIVVGFVLGLWLDGITKTQPVFAFVGLLAGFVSGVYFLIRIVKSQTKDQKDV